MRLAFVFREGLRGLGQNITMTIAMILTTAISLGLFGGGALAGLVGQALLAGIVGGFGRGFSANANGIFAGQHGLVPGQQVSLDTPNGQRIYHVAGRGAFDIEALGYEGAVGLLAAGAVTGLSFQPTAWWPLQTLGVAALVLLPEIALSAEFLDRVETRFGERANQARAVPAASAQPISQNGVVAISSVSGAMKPSPMSTTATISAPTWVREPSCLVL